MIILTNRNLCIKERHSKVNDCGFYAGNITHLALSAGATIARRQHGPQGQHWSTLTLGRARKSQPFLSQTLPSLLLAFRRQNVNPTVIGFYGAAIVLLANEKVCYTMPTIQCGLDIRRESAILEVRGCCVLVEGRFTMTAFLPPNLLALFAPRDPIPFLTPLDKPRHLRKAWLYSGVAQYLNEFEVRCWHEKAPMTHGLFLFKKISEP